MSLETTIYVLAAGLLIVLALLLGPLLLGRLFMPRLTLKLFKRFGGILRPRLEKISPSLDLKLMVRAGNRYFRRSFASTDFNKRLMFIPFCLRPRDCPAGVSRERGLLCDGSCPGCTLGQVRNEALELGYQDVYVVPSSRILKDEDLLHSHDFIKKKMDERQAQAALGIVCAWHLHNRLMPRFKVGRRGYSTGQGAELALQGVLLTARNCKSATVDWKQVRKIMRAGLPRGQAHHGQN